MIQVHERTYLERVDTKNIKNFQTGKIYCDDHSSLSSTTAAQK